MRNSRLPAFLRESAGRTFDFETLNCCLWLGDWAMAAMQCEDPAAQWRGRFKTPAEAFAALGRGGLLRAVARCAQSAGVARTRDPMPGDIGVVALDGLPLIGAIRVAQGWVFLSEPAGLSKWPDEAAAAGRVVMAWRIEER